MSKDQREDMTASEMAMRKFLKQLGVTAHQELADALGKDLIRRYRAHVALVDDQSADILSWMRSVQIDYDDN